MVTGLSEKRRTPRIQPFVAACRIVQGERTFTAYLTDLSPHGARVSCQGAPPALEGRVLVEVRLRGGTSRTRLPARVRWVRPWGPGTDAHFFGLTFEGLSGAEQQAVEGVVREFERLVAQLA
jgi:PilZ domain-containing protein